MSENPLIALKNAYNDQVKEIDENGYAEKLKSCAETFFESVNKEYALNENSVHFSDVEYRDGYFIFGSGTNSIVYFHIDECPGWLFGIWWNVPDDSKDENPCISGELFAQYEETINKFKPSRSELCVTIKVNDKTCLCESAGKMIAFIRNEPYLAFCRDYLGWNYNEEYHSRGEASAEYGKYMMKRDIKEECIKECNEKILTFVTERILPMYADAKIEDRGVNWSPRYAVVAPLKGNEQVVDEFGLYGWCDEDEEEGKKITEDFKALIEECEKICDEHNVFWCCPIHDAITFYDQEMARDDSEIR